MAANSRFSNLTSPTIETGGCSIVGALLDTHVAFGHAVLVALWPGLGVGVCTTDNLVHGQESEVSTLVVVQLDVDMADLSETTTSMRQATADTFFEDIERCIREIDGFTPVHADCHEVSG